MKKQILGFLRYTGFFIIAGAIIGLLAAVYINKDLFLLIICGVISGFLSAVIGWFVIGERHE